MNKRLSTVALAAQQYQLKPVIGGTGRGTSKQANRPSKYIRNVMAYNRAREDGGLDGSYQYTNEGAGGGQSFSKYSIEDSLLQNES